MRTGLLAILLPVVLSAGCMYQARVNQQLLERELRLEEDCIYRLKWQLEDTQHELEATKATMETLQKQADVLRDRGGGSGPDIGPPPLAPEPGGRGGNPGRLPPAPSLPSIEPGIEAPPSGSAAPGKLKSSSLLKLDGPALQASAAIPDKRVLRPAERVNPDANVDRIILNPGLTGGLNEDGQPSGDQLGVVIEQRDANDNRVLAPGDVSIVVVDPAIAGSAGRIARWNFDSDEVVQHVRRNHDGGSLQFELPWQTPPEHSDLRLFVRFTTYDGRRLEANLPIEVQLADDGPGKWRKSKVSLVGHSDDGSSDSPNTAANVRSNKPRSVYASESGDSDSDSSSADSQRSAKNGTPSWSPNR